MIVLNRSEKDALMRINTARRTLERFAAVAKTSKYEEVAAFGREVEDITTTIFDAESVLGIGTLLLERSTRRW